MEQWHADLVQRLESVDVAQLSKLLPSVVAESVPAPSASSLERENARLRNENQALRSSKKSAGPMQTDGMGLLQLVFQGLALGVTKDQLETALTAGATDGGAAAREALLKLVGSNVKRKTAQPEQPAVTTSTLVPLEGGHQAQLDRKPAAATAHLGDAILGDGNPGAYSGYSAPASRGLLSSASAPVWQEDSCGPEVTKTCRRLMTRVRTHPLDDDVVYAEQGEEQWDNFEETRDPDGELLMKIMVEAIQDSGKDSWIDPDFPPDNSSLFQDQLTAAEIEAIANGEQTFRKDKDPFLSGVQDIQWKRAAEIGDPDVPAVIWSQDIHQDDIQQGRLGNCYYLAALASCAVGERDVLIRDLIVRTASRLARSASSFSSMGGGSDRQIDRQAGRQAGRQADRASIPFA